MATVAEQLRLAREEQKLTIYQAAETTKIKTEHIRALEAGQYDVFSAPVYIRGFVRNYAKFLKLDGPAISAALELELSQDKKHCEPPPLSAKTRHPLDFLMLQFSKLNQRRVLVVLGVAIFLVVCFVIARSFSTQAKPDPLKKLGPGLYQPAPNQSGETLPLPAQPLKK
jgi:cytoskeleton protein RodZ